MAFPVVATTNTSNQTAGTSHTVNLPASISAGDLLIVFFVNEDDTTVTTPTGWTLLKAMLETGAATNKMSIFYKVATGAEGATLSITTSSSRVSSHISYKITGYTGAPQVSTGATSTSGNPNPDSLTPSGGAKDYLWIAACSTRFTSGAISSYPTNYSGSNLNSRITGALGGSNVAVGTRNLNASSEDPGTFDFPTNQYWTACTIAIEPTGSSIKLLPLLGVGV